MENELLLHTETTLDSCHQLNGYEGKCKNLHGHTWKVEAWFKGKSSKKNKLGILVDFGIIKDIKEELDHKNLNNVLGYNPTAENLSEWIYNNLHLKLVNTDIRIKIRVYETAVGKETWCEFGDFD